MAQIKTNLQYGTTGNLPAVSGASLTALNGSQVTSGTLPMARLSGTLPALNGSALTSLTSGNLSGNLPALNASALTTLNASNVSSGTLNTARYVDSGGITHLAQWRLSSGLTGGADPISANLETVDTDGFAILGSDMAVSSGIWTFPATGMWLVKGHGNVYFNGDSRHQHFAIHTTTNNSSYSLAASGYSFLQQTESNTTQNSMEVDFIFDVTNTTNCKCKFAFENVTNSSVILEGGSSVSYTWFTFIRLGDT